MNLCCGGLVRVARVAGDKGPDDRCGKEWGGKD